MDPDEVARTSGTEVTTSAKGGGVSSDTSSRSAGSTAPSGRDSQEQARLDAERQLHEAHGVVPGKPSSAGAAGAKPPGSAPYAATTTGSPLKSKERIA